MTFISVDTDRGRLEALTRLLIELFPGSTVYQHTDPVRVPGDLTEGRVDAVFAAAEDCGAAAELLALLRGRGEGLPVFILSACAELRETVRRLGAAGCFAPEPGGEELRSAVLAAKRGEPEI